MKRYKIENSDKLEIGQVFYAKRFVLTVDRSLCKGCVICKLICPRYAITIKPAADGPDGRALAPVIDIDENKCDFHGICAVACPFSAITISIDGADELPAVSKGVFPVLTRDIGIDSTKCEPSCIKCEEKCPLDIISVKTHPPSVEGSLQIPGEASQPIETCEIGCGTTPPPAGGTPPQEGNGVECVLNSPSEEEGGPESREKPPSVEEASLKGREKPPSVEEASLKSREKPPSVEGGGPEGRGLPPQTIADVKSKLCAGCMICWEACPTDALTVTKFIEGAISIDHELCPDGCRRCLDVCPVGALYIDDNEKIGVKNTNCIYCGTCENVCPKPQALKIERTAIRHSPIESGAWNKGLEKITSTAALNKELAASRTVKARAAVYNLK